MTILTVEYKLVSVEYFLDRMQWFELQILMDNLNVSVKNDWLIARDIMWASLRPWSKNLKPGDVRKFPWEGGSQRRRPEVTEELRQRMQKQAEASKAKLIAAGIL